jgi:hypothetical protein
MQALAASCEELRARTGNPPLVPVKIFQFHDMHYESERYRDAANGLLFLARSCHDLTKIFVFYCQDLGMIVKRKFVKRKYIFLKILP